MTSKRYPILFVLLLSWLLTACSPVPQINISYDPATLHFSGEEGLAIESEFVGRFPNRHSGQPNNRLAAEWLQAEFTRLGWDCRLDEWEIINFSHLVPLNNLVCKLPGKSSQ